MNCPSRLPRRYAP